MKNYLRLLAIPLGLLLMVGCVAPIAPQSSTTPITPSDAPAAEVEALTRDNCPTITHDMGETEVCGTPKSVIVIGPHMLDILLSLGVQPVGFAEVDPNEGEEPGDPIGSVEYIGDLVIDPMPTNVGSREEPNLEVMTALKPDLILSEMREEEELELFRQIAPPLAFQGGNGGDWQRTIVPIAAALNTPEKADEVLADYETFLEEKRAELAPFIAEYPRISFVAQNQDGEVSTFDEDTFVGALLTDLGFELVYFTGGDGSGDLSVEQMPEVETDTIVVGASGSATPELAEELWTGNAVLMAHPASAAGRVFFADYQLWSRIRGPIAARLVTEELLRFLNEAK